MPDDWDDMDDEAQLRWARRTLMEIAADDDGKPGIRAMAANALARSLEPKGAKAAPGASQGPGTGTLAPASDRAYLEALYEEIRAKLADLDKRSD